MDLSNLELSHAHGESLYEQLVHALESAIDQGDLSPGARLPSERELAGLLKLSRTTTTNAYRELESRGVLRRLWYAPCRKPPERRTVMGAGATGRSRNRARWGARGRLPARRARADAGGASR